jgi:hypothetical protein
VKRAALLIAGLLITATLVLGGCGQQSEPAEAQASGDPPGVVRIGQQVVTRDDFREGVRIVETNLEYMKGEVAKGSYNSNYMQAFVQLIEQTGIQNVALGALIQDRALYEHALAKGFAATEQEITARAEQIRDHIRNTPDGAQVAASIDAIGEDGYWSELYPAIARREIAIQKMWTNRENRVAVWADVEKQALDSVSIEVLDAESIAPATVSNALAYLDKYRQLPR